MVVPRRTASPELDSVSQTVVIKVVNERGDGVAPLGRCVPALLDGIDHSHPSADDVTRNRVSGSWTPSRRVALDSRALSSTRSVSRP